MAPRLLQVAVALVATKSGPGTLSRYLDWFPYRTRRATHACILNATRDSGLPLRQRSRFRLYPTHSALFYKDSG